MTEDTNEIDRIERELAASRARLDTTIAALQQKLSPGELISQATTYFKEGSGMDLSHTIGRSLRDNPVPVALIGLGLGWLAMSGSRRGSLADELSDGADDVMNGRREYGGGAYRRTAPGRVPETAAHRSMPYQSGLPGDLGARLQAAGALRREPEEDDGSFQDRVATAKGAVVGVTRDLGEAAAAFRDRVEQAVATASDGVRRAGRDAMALAGDAGSAVGDAAGSLVDRGEASLRNVYDYGRSTARDVRDGAGDAVHRAQDLGARATAYLQEQPLLLGAIGVTLGAALGMLLPSSRYEREMLGEVRQGLRDSAAEAVRDVRDRAVSAAESVVDTAHEAAQREGIADPADLVASARDQVADKAGRLRGAVEKSAAAGRQAVERELSSDDTIEPANGADPRPAQHDRSRFAG